MARTKADDAQKALERRCVELEKNQESAKLDSELLIKVVQRLSSAASGVDAELDHLLQPLQDALKTSPLDPVFRRRAGALDRGMLKVVQRRDDMLSAFQGSLMQAVKQFASLPLAPETEQQIASLRENLKRAGENFYDFPELLQAWLRVQSEVLDRFEEGEANQAGSVRVESLSMVSKAICNHLIDLLEQLSVPHPFIAQARRLIQRLESDVDLNSLDSVVQEVIELALKAVAYGHDDFEEYLNALNTQLDDIQKFLGDSKNLEQLAKNRVGELDQAVQSDLSKMEVVLEQSSSIDQLKSGVREQLAGIAKVMDRYRQGEAEREAQAAHRLEELQQKIEAMEKQAESVQSHLAEQRLRALSDPLTGLPNRAAYDEQCQIIFNKCEKSDIPLSLVVCDLDLFKRINDGYGHLAGDKVLRLIAKVLSGGLRESDFVARFGGEEFVVLLPDTQSGIALELMNKLRRVLEASPFNFKGDPVQITMSFGIAQRRKGESAEALFGRADEALYRAKAAGRNRCVVDSD